MNRETFLGELNLTQTESNYQAMTKNHKYITSTDYINQLPFDYLETYSFCRGNEYDRNLEIIQPEYNRLRIRKEKKGDLSFAEEIRFKELSELLSYIQYLLTSDGRFHLSAQKVNTFHHNDPHVDQLKKILRTDIIEVPDFMCAPKYRDAIVFYDRTGNIISVLNVCLSCFYMQTSPLIYIDGDYKTYDLLKVFFIEVGHRVEEPTY